MVWLKKFCEDNDTTEYQISKKTNISQTSLSSINRRKTPIENVKGDTVRKIGKTVNKTVEQMYEEYGEE